MYAYIHGLLRTDTIKADDSIGAEISRWGKGIYEASHFVHPEDVWRGSMIDSRDGLALSSGKIAVVLYSFSDPRAVPTLVDELATVMEDHTVLGIAFISRDDHFESFMVVGARALNDMIAMSKALKEERKKRPTTT